MDLINQGNQTAPLNYWLASQDSRAQVCNGCGTKGFGSWICPDTLYGLNITKACDIHDWMYQYGNTIDDKRQADRVFLNNMLRLIEQNTTTWDLILAPLRRRRALKYYEAVKYFGGPSFWAETVAEPCPEPL